MKVALLQLNVTEDKELNINNVKKFFLDIVKKDVDVVVLPEMFNTKYEAKYMLENAEDEKGDTITLIKELAKENKVNVIAGSIPLKVDDKIYNTCFVIDRFGNVLHKYNKRHIFTVNIEGKARSDEGSVITAGNESVFFELEGFKCSVIICYDIRFFDVFSRFDEENVEVLFMPGAFNDYTGKAHWEVLARARSIDYQMYSVLVSPAATNEGRFKIYGHSMFVDPFGEVVCDLGRDEGYTIIDIDKNKIESVRKKLKYREERKCI